MRSSSFSCFGSMKMNDKAIIDYCDPDLIARVLPDRIAAKSMPKPT